MTQEEMWEAVCRNDASYDGMFFYAVKSTGVYCRPSCKSKKPKRENICFFDTAEQARTAGFRPCKRCRSDLLEYQPIREIAQKAKRLIEESFCQKGELNQRLKHLGVSRRRLDEIFKTEYGLTMFEYMDKLRLEEAKRLLSETSEEIIDIAYAAGFGSLPSFYRFFKKCTGLSPVEFRKKQRKP